MDVVTLGELLIDFTNNGMSSQGNPMFEANPGGAVPNVMSMLQRLGHDTAFIGKVGNDFFGHMLEDALKEQGIDASGLKFDEKIHTTLALVAKKADGDRDFAFYRNPGADMMLSKEDVDAELIRSSKIFHYGSLSMTDEPCESATKFAIDTAKEAGLILTFDPNLRPTLWHSMEQAKELISYGLTKCDVLKISDDEIEFMTGETDIEKGVNKIIDEYHIPLVCATMGKDGSKAFWNGMVVDGKPYSSPDTIETTGAGDCFGACMIHYVLKYGLNDWNEERLAEMLKFANAAACLVTTRRGALRVMPTVEEVQDFIGKIM